MFKVWKFLGFIIIDMFIVPSPNKQNLLSFKQNVYP